MRFIDRVFLLPDVLKQKARQTYWRLRLHTKNRFRVNGRIVVLNPERVTIGNNTTINEGVFIDGYGTVTIGEWVRISPYVVINTGGLEPEQFRAERRHRYQPVVIEDGVWIGTNALINPGVRLGHDCVVGAGAVVTKDVAPNTVVVGVPAKPIRELPHPSSP